ncbi:MAG TPA: hypothetical protein VK634_03290 [Reyranella sp.]|nr:hypothetical protein [Reyranella sp.]
MTIASFLSKALHGAVLIGLLASPAVAVAQATAARPAETDCAGFEPDPVQISWNAPCDEGSWLFEPGVGCRMWDWRPTSSDVVTWTGACRKGSMVGPGTLQWTEHERLIDRFQGTFVDGKRQGPGRYTWNESDWYVGFYENDLPHGLGTASIGGHTFSGQWQAGCFKSGDRTVAIGVPLTSCEHVGAQHQAELARGPTAAP